MHAGICSNMPMRAERSWGACPYLIKIFTGIASVLSLFWAQSWAGQQMEFRGVGGVSAVLSKRQPSILIASPRRVLPSNGFIPDRGNKRRPLFDIMRTRNWGPLRVRE